MAAQSAMEGLAWIRPGAELTTNLTTKSGMPQYDGSAHGFQEWRFRVLAKNDAFSAKEKDDRDQSRKELASKVLEGLSGDALNTIMDLGRETVVSPDGVTKMVEAIKESITGKKVIEVKDLYREGTRQGGLLSRQRGEPMPSYISRRRRWHSRLLQLDPTYKLPDMLLIDLLLENSGLTSDQQLLVRTTVGKEVTFDAIAKEMREQHPLTQMLDSNRHAQRDHQEPRRPWKTPWRSHRPQNGRPQRQWPRISAYAAATDEEESGEDDEDNDDEESEDNEDAYFATAAAMTTSMPMPSTASSKMLSRVSSQLRQTSMMRRPARTSPSASTTSAAPSTDEKMPASAVLMFVARYTCGARSPSSPSRTERPR